MRRSLLLVTSATAVAAAVIPGYAAPPPADAGRLAATYVTFALGHGRTLSLELRAATLSGGSVLRVLARRCYPTGPCTESAYQSPLAPGALTIDPMTAVAELKTTVAGHAVRVQWRPDDAAGPEVVVGGGEAGGDGVDNSGSDYVGAPAIVGVAVDGRSCKGNGGVGNGAFVDSGAVTGFPSDAELSALRIPAKAPLACH
jgi:hypothetical protein